MTEMLPKIALEGIETEADLACAVGAGIDIGQVYTVDDFVRR